jgi:hypothetical protein
VQVVLRVGPQQIRLQNCYNISLSQRRQTSAHLLLFPPDQPPQRTDFCLELPGFLGEFHGERAILLRVFRTLVDDLRGEAVRVVAQGCVFESGIAFAFDSQG